MVIQYLLAGSAVVTRRSPRFLELRQWQVDWAVGPEVLGSNFCATRDIVMKEDKLSFRRF
jgi:hypothetical protein